ncbi:MAG TPA: replication-relaxation family protein [Dehalococcoidia bacterium]|nr:replication-relaxation family protein [Dehalococcoidia bacterium]
MPTRDSQLQPEAVGWLVRLPFLGAEELSLLLGIRKPQVARVLAELEKLGWAEWVRASSPELDEERLNVLTDGCVPRLAEHFGLSEQELQLTFSVGTKEILERLTRLETTVGFNRFAAELVAAVREDEEVELEDIRSLPLRRSAQAWWPPEVEGYGCLRWGPWRAPFFLVWDRAGAPPFHRRRRVGAWCAFREGDHPWGRDDIPPILVVCPREAEAEQWARAVLASSDRRQAPRLPVFLTDVLCALIGGPLGSVWRRPDGTVRAHLCERLAWRLAFPPQAGTIRAENATEQLDTVSASGPALRTWAGQLVESPGETARARSSLERLAALSLVTSPTEKRALEWLGHHPLLSADELAVILRISGQLAARVLDNLARRGLVQSTDKALENEAAPPRRYYLTDVGLKLLAARDGVPPRRYARYGIVAASMPKKQGGGRLETLQRQLDHTVGVNRFFVRLIADGAKNGPRLIRWLSASEAAQKFTYGEVTHWLRPDGAGDVYWNGRLWRFYLEWDRGTVSWPDMIEKFRAYGGYLARLRLSGCDEAGLPTVLIVTASPLRERVIGRSLQAVLEEAKAPTGRAFTSIDSLVQRLGPWSRVWLAASGRERTHWLLPDAATLKAAPTSGQG